MPTSRSKLSSPPKFILSSPAEVIILRFNKNFVQLMTEKRYFTSLNFFALNIQLATSYRISFDTLVGNENIEQVSINSINESPRSEFVQFIPFNDKVNTNF